MTTSYTERPDGSNYHDPREKGPMSPEKRKKIEALMDEQKLILEELEIEKGIEPKLDCHTPRTKKKLEKEQNQPEKILERRYNDHLK